MKVNQLLKNVGRDFSQNLRQNLKDFVYPNSVPILDKVGIFPVLMHDKENIKGFLKKVHPVTTDKKLIRLGPNGDGGYLVPDDLEGIPACFSPGVSFTSGFEKDCADLGMEVFMADASVDQPADIHPKFHFEKKFLGVTTNDVFMTLDDWVRQAPIDPSADLLLQIDIEGFEYEVFLAASDALMKRFRIIVAEFHDLEHFWEPPFFRLASRAFDKILQTHACVHIHPNNANPTLRKRGLEIVPVTEFTFLRRDRILESSPSRQFPHPLDFDNTAHPTVVLSDAWYEN